MILVELSPRILLIMGIVLLIAGFFIDRTNSDIRQEVGEVYVEEIGSTWNEVFTELGVDHGTWIYEGSHLLGASVYVYRYVYENKLCEYVFDVENGRPYLRQITVNGNPVDSKPDWI